MIVKRLTRWILLSVVIALVRRYFVPLLTRTTGTWMGGVDSADRN